MDATRESLAAVTVCIYTGCSGSVRGLESLLRPPDCGTIASMAGFLATEGGGYESEVVVSCCCVRRAWSAHDPSARLTIGLGPGKRESVPAVDQIGGGAAGYLGRKAGTVHTQVVGFWHHRLPRWSDPYQLPRGDAARHVR